MMKTPSRTQRKHFAKALELAIANRHRRALWSLVMGAAVPLHAAPYDPSAPAVRLQLLPLDPGGHVGVRLTVPPRPCLEWHSVPPAPWASREEIKFKTMWALAYCARWHLHLWIYGGFLGDGLFNKAGRDLDLFADLVDFLAHAPCVAAHLVRLANTMGFKASSLGFSHCQLYKINFCSCSDATIAFEVDISNLRAYYPSYPSPEFGMDNWTSLPDTTRGALWLRPGISRLETRHHCNGLPVDAIVRQLEHGGFLYLKDITTDARVRKRADALLRRCYNAEEGGPGCWRALGLAW